MTDPFFTTEFPPTRRTTRRCARPSSGASKHRVATPADWKQGQDVIIATSVTDDDAKQQFPNGWKTLKPYLRVVAQPRL